MALLTIQRSSSAGSAAPPSSSSQNQQPQQQQPHQSSSSDTNSNSGSLADTTTTTTTVETNAATEAAPPSAKSDLAGLADDEEVRLRKSQNESYFAGRSQLRILGGSTTNDQFLTSIEGQPLSSIRGGTDLNIAQNGSDIQQHLQSMFYLLRQEETLKMAVKLETARNGRTRYLVVVSRPAPCRHTQTPPPPLAASPQVHRPDRLKSNTPTTPQCKRSHSTAAKLATAKSQPTSENTDQSVQPKCDRSTSLNEAPSCEAGHLCNESEESCLLGIDCNDRTTVGLVLRIQADTTIRLDGDGGFSVSSYGRTHIFKPVSVQSMWSALQTLHKVSAKARYSNFYPGGPSHEWAQYYEDRIESERSCLNEWNAMDSLESRRPPSPDALRNKPKKREETEQVIKTALKEIMMSVDLDEVTSKYIRSRLEEHLDMDLGEFKSFIDEEMLIILGQMDAPTEIFEHVYLGSEWNASNLEELQKNGVGHILNVTREIDNFFPGMFDYLNIRVYDDEKTNLLKHWDNTFKYITQAHKTGSKVLVHCKMGVSRSASVVIAYAMKAYSLNFNTALRHVKLRRSCIKPNKSFLQQLETYQGMLDAMKNKEKLQRSKSETNLRSSSTKDGRLLPGSEPTPLIQALNSLAAASPSVDPSVSSGRDSVDARRSPHNVGPIVRRFATLTEKRHSDRRPSSWSPDHVEAMVLLPKQQSQSLENLTPERKEEKTKNVLLPCSNGQNYSVSQNQVVYLQENVPSVKLIVSELESNRARTQLARRNRRTIGGVEEAIWTQPRDTVAATASSINQSSALHKPQQPPPHQPINQLASKSQTTVKPNIIMNHHSQHPNQQRNTNTTTTNNNNNHHLLCDSPAWTSLLPTTYSPPTSISPSCSHSTNTTHTKSTIYSSAPTHHQPSITTPTPTIPLPQHHKSTDIHLCLSESMASGGSPVNATTTPSPAYVSRRSDKVLSDPNPYLTQPLSKPSSTRPAASNLIDTIHQAQPTMASSTSLRSHHHHHHREMPSRHSSWGSGDTRTLPTRNSSWAAFDLRPSSTSSHFFRGNAAGQPTTASSTYDRDDIPWHPGTVKRTKQKIESSAVVKRKCAVPPDPAAKHDQTTAPPPPARRLTPTNRWHSDEVLQPGTVRRLSPSTSSVFQRLSASAPETSTIGCLASASTTVTASPVPPPPTTSKRRNNQSRTTHVIMSQRSLDASDGMATSFAATNSYGLVQNLKQNFESGQRDAKKKVKSLPSSPIAAHPEKYAPVDRQFNKFSDSLENQEERNVRGLVDRYEVQKSPVPYAIKPRPRSEYISNSSFGYSKPHMISHATIFNRSDDFRRPPVPPSPIVRNALASASIFGPVVTPVVVSSTQLSGGSNTLSFRKMQQHGKTHPLSRLGLTNPRLTPATYNTM